MSSPDLPPPRRHPLPRTLLSLCRLTRKLLSYAVPPASFIRRLLHNALRHRFILSPHSCLITRAALFFRFDTRETRNIFIGPQPTHVIHTNEVGDMFPHNCLQVNRPSHNLSPCRLRFLMDDAAFPAGMTYQNVRGSVTENLCLF